MGMALAGLAADASLELKLGRDIDSLFTPYDEGDTAPLLLRRAFIKAADELNTEYTWQFQQHEWTFQWSGGDSMLASAAASGVPIGTAVVTETWMAPDFLRFTPDTMHSRTHGWKLCGPLSSRDWQDSRINGGIYSGAFRIAGNEMLMTPRVGIGHLLAYDYVTRNLCLAADGSGKPRPTADTDVFPWDDETMILGAVYQYRKMERLDYADHQMEFQQRAQNALRMDGHSATFSMTSGGHKMRGIARWLGLIF